MKPLTAWVLLDYWLRRVDSGKQSYEEGVQDVTLIKGHNETCQAVLPVSQIVPPLYTLVGPDDANGSAAAVEVGRHPQRKLLFTGLDSAQLAADWLNAEPRSTAFGTVSLSVPPGGVVVKRFVNDAKVSAQQCKAAPVSR